MVKKKTDIRNTIPGHKQYKKSKEVKPLVHIPRWTTVATRQVKWDSLTMTQLKEWITEKVPTGTSDDNIKLSFEITEEWGYYDDCTTEAVMSLEVLE